MTIVNGVTILLIFQLIGEASAMLLSLPVPGPVLGMILLFLTLVLRGGSTSAVDSASSALLRHLSLLFVPAGVGMMAHLDLISREWKAIVVTLALSTVITMVATAAIMHGLNQLRSRRVRNNG